MKLKKSTRGLVISLHARDLLAGTVEEAFATLAMWTLADYYAERSLEKKDALITSLRSMLRSLEWCSEADSRSESSSI